MNKNFRTAALTLLISSAAACTWFSPPKSQPSLLSAPPPEPLAPAVVAAESQKPPLQKEFIEVVWQIPDAKVDSYVIRYGTDRDHLSNTISIRPEDAQKIQHEHYGQVYRFLIPNPPPNKTVYVTVAAVSNGNESAPTRAFEVAPNSDNSTGSSQAPTK